MTLFENNSVIVALDTSTPCLEWIGKGPLTSQDFRESEEKSLAYYQEYKSQYPDLEWFVDARKIRSLSSDDVEWVAQEILPQFAAAGLTKEVFVIPESALGRFVVNDYTDLAGNTVEVRAVASIEEAKQWLSD
jgi:hypothetical protein